MISDTPDDWLDSATIGATAILRSAGLTSPEAVRDIGKLGVSRLKRVGPKALAEIGELIGGWKDQPSDEVVTLRAQVATLEALLLSAQTDLAFALETIALIKRDVSRRK